MKAYTITPKVDETQEFIEIANDFSNPLDLVREAISNAYDANASEIRISFDVIKQYGEAILKRKFLRKGLLGRKRPSLRPMRLTFGQPEFSHFCHP